MSLVVGNIQAVDKSASDGKKGKKRKHCLIAMKMNGRGVALEYL